MQIDDDARKERLLEWLTTPKQLKEEYGWPSSTDGIALELGVSRRTIFYWKKDPEFRARWERDARDKIGDPSRVQELLDMLAREAHDQAHPLSARVQAAALVLKETNTLKPSAGAEASRRASELSDAELEAMIAEAAQLEQARRKLS